MITLGRRSFLASLFAAPIAAKAALVAAVSPAPLVAAARTINVAVAPVEVLCYFAIGETLENFGSVKSFHAHLEESSKLIPRFDR